MNNEVFIKTLNDYKELLKSNYKAPIWTIFANFLFFVIFSFVVLKTASFFHSLEASMLGMVILIFSALYAMAKIEHRIPSLLQYKFNLKLVLENKIKKLSYTGKLSEIFDFNCLVTKEIIVWNHKYLEKELVENKSINGSAILDLFAEINKQKKIKLAEEQKQTEIVKLQEEKEALINADTKIGQSLKELLDIKSESNKDDE